MVGVRRALVGSLAGLVAVLAAVSTSLDLTLGEWVAGLGCWLILAGAVRLGAARVGADHIGPADLVTLGRATLACAVAALVVEAWSESSALLVALATVALVLDAVDGRVARTTRTETRFGARFDGEADAFLILVMSVHAAATYGAWVLAIGAARYAFGAAGLALPWLRAELPPRQWRKVVAAVQGIVLVIAAADVLYPVATYAALIGALVLLAESFGRDVLWLWRRRGPRHDDRAGFAAALEPARQAAYPPGEYVGQESFMRAAEIRALARRAGVAPGVSLVDLCCGVAGPGRLITAELGCCYLGVDTSPAAVELARGAAGDLPCRFEVASVPPLPDGPFDVVLLLETLLAFREKGPLLEQVASALRVGGRLALTVEAGPPLTPAEQAAMPAAETVWPVPLPELVAGLRRVGLEVGWTEDLSRAHRATADALADAFLADRAAISSRIGGRAVDDLVVSHRLWSTWLRSGRIRKVAVVATKTAGDPATGEPAAPPARCVG